MPRTSLLQDKTDIEAALSLAVISKMGRESLSRFCVAEGLIEEGVRIKVEHMVDLVCDWVSSMPLH